MDASIIIATLSHLSREEAYTVALEKAAFHADRTDKSGFHAEMTSMWIRAAEVFE